MAIDATTRTILVKMGISTEQWDKWIRKMRSDLESLHGAALKSHEDKMKRAQAEIAAVEKQKAAEEELLQKKKQQAAEDQAAAANARKLAEERRAAIQQSLLETAELKKQSLEQKEQVELQRQQLGLERQRLALELQRARAQESMARGAGVAANPAAVAKIKGDIGLTAFAATARPTMGAAQVVPAQVLEEVAAERQRLQLIEAELRLQAEQRGLQNADVAAVEKEIGAERTKLGVLEAQARASQRQLVQERELAAQMARQPDLARVAALKQQIGFRPACQNWRIVRYCARTGAGGHQAG
jgi:hypothetical protein